MRQAAGQQFADVVIGVPPGAAVGQGHAAADAVEDAVHGALPDSDVVVHVEPQQDEAALRERALAAAQRVPRVREIHNLSVLRVGGSTEVSLHLKLPGELPLEDAHEVATEVERAIVESVPEVDAVQTHLEPLAEAAEGESVDGDRDLVERIVREQTGQAPRELRFLRTDDGLLAYLTLSLDPGTSLADAHSRASEIEERIRSERPEISDVIVHTEPMKLCMFTPLEHEIRGWPGRIEGDRVIQLAAQTLEAFFTGGGNAREHAEYPLDEVRLLAPVQRPPSVRDFYAFEEHVRNARAVTGPRRGRAGVVRDPGLLLLEPGRDLRAGRRDPVPRGLGGAGLRARGGRGDRRRTARSAASRS